jgi:hypothetical protein
MNRRNLLLSLALIAGLVAPLISAGPAAAQSDPLAEKLARSAEAAGVPINTEETVTVTAPGVNLATTSIRGFEQVPATDFAKGSDFGYLYLDTPTRELPAGGYKMRVHADADAIQLGQYPGTVDLIDANGKVARTVAADIGTSSLSVPEPLPFPRTRVSAWVDNGGEPTGGGSTEPQGIIIIHGWYHCPNGSWVFVTIIIWDW